MKTEPVWLKMVPRWSQHGFQDRQRVTMVNNGHTSTNKHTRKYYKHTCPCRGNKWEPCVCLSLSKHRINIKILQRHQHTQSQHRAARWRAQDSRSERFSASWVATPIPVDPLERNARDSTTLLLSKLLLIFPSTCTQDWIAGRVEAKEVAI